RESSSGRPSRLAKTRTARLARHPCLALTTPTGATPGHYATEGRQRQSLSDEQSLFPRKPVLSRAHHSNVSVRKTSKPFTPRAEKATPPDGSTRLPCVFPHSDQPSRHSHPHQHPPRPNPHPHRDPFPQEDPSPQHRERRHQKRHRHRPRRPHPRDQPKV